MNKLFVLCLLVHTSAFAWDALPQHASAPAENPMTAQKIELGKKLFFDPRISADGTVSCNSCHNVMKSGDDGRPHSVGIQGKEGGRSAPTVWNAAFLSVQFWDGRAKSLEEQAKGPMINPVEMGNSSHEPVISRILKVPGYVEEFKKAFPKEKDITIDHVAKAIATYERTLITPNSPYDLYVRGNKKAMSAAAIRGMATVQSVGCLSCHSGANFSGPTLPEGVGFYQKFPRFPGSEYDKKYDLTSDSGRFQVTKNPEDQNSWRVPTWRNIALTAPYFHNGKVQSLDEAVRVMAKTQLNQDLKPEQVSDIVAFLESLSGKFPDQKMPRLPDISGKAIY